MQSFDFKVSISIDEGGNLLCQFCLRLLSTIPEMNILDEIESCNMVQSLSNRGPKMHNKIELIKCIFVLVSFIVRDIRNIYSDSHSYLFTFKEIKVTEDSWLPTGHDISC